MQLHDKNIIVTGGTLGIGKATARQLVDKGARVIITGRNKERLEKAAIEVGATPFLFDISDLDRIEAKSKELVEVCGNKIDAVINNAGIGGEFSLVEDLKKEDFYNVFNTNVFGLALFTKELIPTLRSNQETPSIVNIGSTASLKSFARGSVYAASKFAVRALSQTWQQELRKDNIRVIHVNPSEVTTAFNNDQRTERTIEANKLDSDNIATTIVNVLEMENKALIPEVTVWATNPF